jgi:hypothetical protein
MSRRPVRVFQLGDDPCSRPRALWPVGGTKEQHAFKPGRIRFRKPETGFVVMRLRMDAQRVSAQQILLCPCDFGSGRHL